MNAPKFERFDYLVWAILAALALAIAGVALAGDHVGARVTRTFPADGQVGARGRVGLEFGQVMEAASAEARFQIEPPVAGQLQWAGTQLWFQPAGSFQPGVTYTARLEAGAASRQGRTTQQTLTWQFRVRAPEIAFLASVAGPREVWRVPAAGGQPVQLTSTGGKVFDFAVAPDGEQIVFSVVNERNGIDLWLWERAGGTTRPLVACGLDICTVPAWSPINSQIAYSREPAGLAPGAPNGPPRVWIVDAATGQTAALYADTQILGYGPVWSPDGRRLAFYDASENGLRLLDTGSQQELVVETLMGTVGAWSPDGGQMLLTNMNFEGEQPRVVLLLADFEAQVVRPVLADQTQWADFGAPAWSPDGQWLALALRGGAAGPGKQIWRMRPDGRDARAVTADSRYTFGGSRWDPWGTALVFQRFELNVPYAKPELVVWSAADDSLTMLVPDGSMAEWLP